MKNTNTLLIAILIGSIFLTCQNNASNDDSKNENNEEVKREKAINNFASKYSAEYLYDTLDYNYTIEFDKFLNKKILVSEFEVIDIYTKEQKKYFRISANHNLSHDYLDLELDENNLKMVLSAEFDILLYNTNYACLIELSNMKKVDLEINFATYGYSAEDFEIDIDLGYTRNFHGYGKLLAIEKIDD